MAVDLVIVGASIRAAAFSALRGGFQPAGADLFADQDLAATCPVLVVEQKDYRQALRSWPGTDWIYTGALENQPRLVGQMATESPLLGNGQEVLVRLGQPREIWRTLTRAGLACPQVLLDPPAKLQGWLRKPIRSAGGIGIEPADRPVQPLGNKPVYYQQLVDGTAASALFLATPGKTELLGVTRQLVGRRFTAAGQYSYCGSIGPLELPIHLQSQVEAIGSELEGQFSLIGLFGVDLVIDRQRAWFIEINPRYCASAEIIERATDQSMVRLHVDACRKESPEPVPASLAERWGKAILFARQSLVIPDNFRSLIEMHDPDHNTWPLLADLPTAGQQISTGHPVLTVFARGHSLQEVETGLRDKVVQLERQLLPVHSPLATDPGR